MSHPCKMANDVSIFDLPHVMERVASYLDPQDRLSCSFVSRGFHHEFMRHIWSNLRFRHHRMYPEKVNTDQIMAIRRNLRWTQKVNIDTHCHQEILALLSTSCYSLKDLIIIATGEDDPEGVTFLPVIDVIVKNTTLRTCSLIRYNTLSRNSLGRLAGALSLSRSLTELALEFHVVPIPHDWFQYALQNLPNTLKRLSLEWRKWRSWDGSESFPARNWPGSYPNLKVAKLRVELTEPEEETFIQFLKRCPSLNECHVPEMSSNQSLSHFIEALGARQFPFTLETLDGHMWEEISERQWMTLLSALKTHIRSFITELDFTVAPTRHYIYEMTRHWSQTLESLKINNAEFITSSDIQLVMTTCPKLRKLSCFCYWPPWASHPNQGGLDELPGLRVKDYGESSIDGDRTMDWVCLGLEILKLTITDGRSVFVEEPMLSQQEQQVAQGIRRIYEQIGCLKKLTKLTIGWCSSDRSLKSASLDMSLHSGMVHMEKLKKLSMVDINYIPKVNIGMDEAQWMLDNWPMLKTINGLKYRHRESREDGEEPDYVVLLRSRRPWLDLC